MALPQAKSATDRDNDAVMLASAFSIVKCGPKLYIPANYKNNDVFNPIPDEDRIWLPFNDDMLLDVARHAYLLRFRTKTELDNFRFVVNSEAKRMVADPTCVLIRTSKGLRLLNEEGKLLLPDGRFVLNTLAAELNEDPDDKAEVLRVLADWLGSDAQAEMLLRYMATALAPHWSARKYLLFIGSGRNGKSVLLSMLMKLFGPANVTGISREQLTQKPSIAKQLVDSRINIVQDGPASYLKESNVEKTLITGDELAVVPLYSDDPVMIRTTALFVEGLNQEPKTRDKSAALQDRLVRFRFPNTYPHNPTFARHMESERMIGALLSILIDHYIREEDAGDQLKRTKEMLLEQVSHMVENSLGMQFFIWFVESTSLSDFMNLTREELFQKFKQWRLSENDLDDWDARRLNDEFRNIAEYVRKTDPKDKAKHFYQFKKFTANALDVIEIMEYEEVPDAAVVGD